MWYFRCTPVYTCFFFSPKTSACCAFVSTAPAGDKTYYYTRFAVRETRGADRARTQKGSSRCREVFVGSFETKQPRLSHISRQKTKNRHSHNFLGNVLLTSIRVTSSNPFRLLYRNALRCHFISRGINLHRRSITKRITVTQQDTWSSGHAGDRIRHVQSFCLPAFPALHTIHAISVPIALSPPHTKLQFLGRWKSPSGSENVGKPTNHLFGGKQ